MYPAEELVLLRLQKRAPNSTRISNETAIMATQLSPYEARGPERTISVGGGSIAGDGISVSVVIVGVVVKPSNATVVVDKGVVGGKWVSE